MTTGTGSEDDPIEIVDWTSFYGWGVWRTARHYGAKDSNPVATGSYEGITNYVYQNLLPTRNGPRPMLAHLENGRWRAKSFVHHDGMITPISPDSTDEAREKQCDRYDRCHHQGRAWWDGSPDPPANEVQCSTIEVDEKGGAIRHDD